MNILYLHTHDLGRYIQPYGFAPRTPNLQRLADEGATFRNAFCLAPTCSPSRAALLTGRYPHQAGMYGLTGQGWTLSLPEQHLGCQLRDAGMENVLIGVQHVTDHSMEAMRQLPYERLLHVEAGPGDSEYERIAPAAVEFLREPHHRPFFLNVGFDLTHESSWNRSFVLSHPEMGPLDTRSVRPLPHLPDTSEGRLDTALFYRSVEYLDRRIGLILDALDETDLADNTLVVFTTDHGPGLPGIKANLNDRGLGTALILRGPGGFTGGRMIEPMVSHLDIYPTACDVLGLALPDWLEGKSLLSLLETPERPLHDTLFFEQSWHGQRMPLRSARTERYRYVRRIGAEEHTVMYYNAEKYSRSWRQLQAAGLERFPMPREQLFDLIYDPQECVNLIADPACAEVAADLRRRLDDWMDRTGDPARHDTVPEPPPRPPGDQARVMRKQTVYRMWEEQAKALMNRRS